MDMPVVLVPGTWGWSDDASAEWYRDGAPFTQFLIANGLRPFEPNGRPFVWSTRLGGLGFGGGKMATWRAAGINLLDYLVPPLDPAAQLPPSQTRVICHSHGMQVVLFAAAAGLKIDTLISVAGPVRADMRMTTMMARRNIRRWVHLHSDWSDKWQWLGEIGDGVLGIVRAEPLADENDTIPGVGHSRLLRDPTTFHFWKECGWLAALQEGSGV